MERKSIFEIQESTKVKLLEAEVKNLKGELDLADELNFDEVMKLLRTIVVLGTCLSVSILANIINYW